MFFHLHHHHTTNPVQHDPQNGQSTNIMVSTNIMTTTNIMITTNILTTTCSELGLLVAGMTPVLLAAPGSTGPPRLQDIITVIVVFFRNSAFNILHHDFWQP